MTPQRFAELTGIYGAEPRRWPPAERDQALAFMAREPAAAAAALRDAAFLDRLLDSHVVPAPDTVLRERIVGSAPHALWRRARIFWQGAGLAGLGLAGALAGALMVGVILPLQYNPDPDDDGAYAVTAFSDLSDGLDE